MSTLQPLQKAFAGRYELDRELGRGGMATVYLARDVKHARQVAIKVLHPELAAVLGAERFLAEIRTTANLQHPHILPLHDSGSVEGTVFYVMPFVAGESLRERLTREKQLPIDDALRIAREVADALQAAHDQGVIHRDIKPENILVQGGHALVADFGIALAASRTGDVRMTETGMSLGTPQYMSPEQAMGERSLDARTDIYALGCVLYEMLTGEPPFTGPTAQAIVARVMTEEPRSITVQRKTVPAHVDAAVRKALAKIPADRFGSARAFAEALGDESFAAARVTSAARLATPANPWKRATVAASLCAVLLGGAAWRFGRGAGAPVQVTRVLVAMTEGQELRIPGGGTGLSISADGRRIVYVGPGGGIRGTQLWERPLDQLGAKPIPGTNNAEQPKLSRDGRAVFFRRLSSGFVVSLESGEAVALPGTLIDAAWGADRKLYVVRPDGAIDRLLVGGTAEHIVPADSATRRAGLSVLPDERGALFYRGQRGGPDSNLVVRSSVELAGVIFATGAVTRVAAAVHGQYLPTGHLLYMTDDGTAVVAPFDPDRMRVTGAAVPLVKIATTSGFLGRGVPEPQLAVSAEGTLLYVPASVRAPQQLVWLDPDGRERAAVQSDGIFEGLALSHDAGRAAIGLRRETGVRDTVPGVDIWIVDLKTGAKTRLTTTGSNIRPSWSPDGLRVLFPAIGGLFERRADASTPITRVMSDSLLKGNRIAEGAWAPAGRLILRTYPGVRTRDVLLFDPSAAATSGIARDSSIRVLAGSQADETNPRLSPDGRWLAYASTESGRPEVYVIPFPRGGARVAVTTEGASYPRWSGDGRTLYYFTVEGALMMASVHTSPAFSVDGRREHPSHFRFAGSFDPFYDVAADGRILIAKEVEQAHRVVLVRNWFTELTKDTGR